MITKYILSALGVAAIVVFFGLLMVACAYLLDNGTAALIFSEDGFFEQMSPLVWFTASLFLFWKERGRANKYLIFALTFLFFTAREYDLHKAFTSDSILKINFYKQDFALEQVFGGMAAIFVIGLMAATVMLVIRDTLFRGEFKFFSGQLMLAGFGLIALSKVFDRIPAVLRHEHGITLTATHNMMLKALEEGFELFAPILILTALVMHFRRQSSSTGLNHQ